MKDLGSSNISTVDDIFMQGHTSTLWLMTFLWQKLFPFFTNGKKTDDYANIDNKESSVTGGYVHV